MTSAVATQLASWAAGLTPSDSDLRLAHRSLLDTVSVAVAARTHPVMRVAAGLPEVARWAVAGHVLDFDDLHVESTAHISVICVPAVLAAGGDARAYLAAAGAMARLGTALGWHHYSAGWHTTCTAGAPAAALGAGMALGLDTNRLAVAMALAVPAAATPGGSNMSRNCAPTDLDEPEHLVMPTQPDHEVWIRLGKSAMDLHAVLSDSPISGREAYRRAKMAESTGRLNIRVLADHGLADKTPDGWVKGSLDLDRVAETFGWTGVNSKRVMRKVQYEKERRLQRWTKDHAALKGMAA